ncbi:6,7-dimethyl-8-ribityllumazine synthase [Weissella cibaria]|jgi:6,7-dimethyl-8-ribityllumazine synthase|uniref:6,7-dimethyl-8-ribityllumazine synthase n=1 Tax=Weissella cibaria TaxID=137591 RepID=UPI000FFE12BE|nr:6,7-dimethyl-8-ribityllumazine synthase [Weissella cibaria]MBU7562070.1 6,7-dimethyl-8-ribityllumazine synthase [Weissella cibaria]MCA1356358.1 6,7-dimethyl-8-ribityllumazine synthase [Weissella cibaria]MCC6122639.1 6,7-dimethyl-8-ribityllumazine synthase [Weissella cibaria]MCR8702981.1 6,7-dimethyl-8-ribityllumazine synthase [Weissella cibaria]MCS8562184.1 6,7-dimethyl-8-ribityllumazine synthase [Weissella cibaria]
MTTVTGTLTKHEGRHIAIVMSRFNTLITDPLLAGAKEALTMHGVEMANIDVYIVPGAFEIPLVAEKVANTAKYDGIVTLGAVIRGETDHYDLVINGAMTGIAQVGLKTGVPTVFGVLTADTLEQAQHRAGGKAGNKGSEVALALLELLAVVDAI